MLIRRAQGQAEAAAIGADDVLADSGSPVAEAIGARADELADLAGVSA